jgi:hypothetical protein
LSLSRSFPLRMFDQRSRPPGVLASRPVLPTVLPAVSFYCPASKLGIDRPSTQILLHPWMTCSSEAPSTLRDGTTVRTPTTTSRCQRLSTPNSFSTIPCYGIGLASKLSISTCPCRFVNSGAMRCVAIAVLVAS